uniref:Phytocyanin domain-containing protein n=1 Tax=Kalanchoe fedtschenkoi TaxID=63787 RepID=A0A7N0U375_KALFE
MQLLHVKSLNRVVGMKRQRQRSALLPPLILSMATLGLSFQFKVGGDKGWIKPPDNRTEVYNNWAREIRFQVGDTVYFEYVNESVLVVNAAHYNACSVNDPISKHADGETVVELDRQGYFYFISGKPGRCEAGQRLIIDVMAEHYDTETPSPAPDGGTSDRPASGPSGGDRSRVPESAADKSTVSSAVLTCVLAAYMFM